jgi:hypothetical protein
MAGTLRDESDAEDAVAARAQVTTLLGTVRGSLAQLLLVGYDSFTMEEFHEYFLELFQWAVDDKPTSEQIRERLTADQGLDQYIVSDEPTTQRKTINGGEMSALVRLLGRNSR